MACSTSRLPTSTNHTLCTVDNSSCGQKYIGDRREARIFRGVCVCVWLCVCVCGGGCVWAVKVQICRGSGSMPPPRENFRNFGLPWTIFRAFSWWRKREKECRVVKRKSQSPALDLLKVCRRAQNNGWLVSCQVAGQIKFRSAISRFWPAKHILNFQVFKPWRGKLFVH